MKLRKVCKGAVATVLIWADVRVYAPCKEACLQAHEALQRGALCDANGQADADALTRTLKELEPIALMPVACCEELEDDGQTLVHS